MLKNVLLLVWPLSENFQNFVFWSFFGYYHKAAKFLIHQTMIFFPISDILFSWERQQRWFIKPASCYLYETGAFPVMLLLLVKPSSEDFQNLVFNSIFGYYHKAAEFLIYQTMIFFHSMCYIAEKDDYNV